MSADQGNTGALTRPPAGDPDTLLQRLRFNGEYPGESRAASRRRRFFERREAVEAIEKLVAIIEARS